MSDTWYGAPEPPPPALSFGDWLRVLRRGAPLLLILLVAFPLLLLLRVPEALIFGQSRPLTPHITVAVCRAACLCLGLKRHVHGKPMRAPGAFVSNHVSWLDIFVLNATGPMYFVAKSEVRGWPGIGWLARGTGTLFVERKRGAAKAQTADIVGRLAAGHRLMVFPEGTTTDGLRVLRFKSSLFAAFTEPGTAGLSIQPVSLRYRPGGDAPQQFYGWWGEMGIVDGILRVLATPQQGSVETHFHAAIPLDQTTDRKTLAAKAEAAVRAPFEAKSEADACA